LWNTLDAWVTGLNAEDFVAALPLLRRTFSAFSARSAARWVSAWSAAARGEGWRHLN
jgi:hypothetical protein